MAPVIFAQFLLRSTLAVNTNKSSPPKSHGYADVALRAILFVRRGVQLLDLGLFA